MMKKEKILSSSGEQRRRDQAGEITIVNCRNREWVAKLIYTLERAGLKLQEDYRTNGGTDRTLVFEE